MNEGKGSAMFRGFRGNAGSSVGGASATLRYERSHSVSVVTNDVLSELEGGKIVFDVYLQQDGGAGAEAEAASAAAAAAALGRRRRMAREIEPPSLVTSRNQVFAGSSGGKLGGGDKEVWSDELEDKPGIHAIEEGDESDGESGESVLSSGDDEGGAEGGAESNDDEIELARLPEYRDDGEYSDGGSFYPYEEDPYYESYDDEEDAYDDEGERRGANKGIINAAFRRMFRKGKKGTEDSPSVTPARGRYPDESFNASIVPIEDGVKGVKLFDGDEAVDTRSAVNSTPASPNPFETSVEDNGSRGGSGRASTSMMSPMRLLSPLGSNKVEPTNVVDVQRNDRERRRREKKERKDRKEARKGEREKIARQPRDFGATTATGADPGVYEQTPEPIQPPAPRANPMIFGGGSALGGGGSVAGTVPAKRDWYKELHSAEDTPEADRKDRG